MTSFETVWWVAKAVCFICAVSWWAPIWWRHRWWNDNKCQTCGEPR